VVRLGGLGKAAVAGDVTEDAQGPQLHARYGIIGRTNIKVLQY
jgi:hypothetical protein